MTTATPDMPSAQEIEAFIKDWGESGGGEQANSQSFLNAFCDLIRVSKPEPSKEEIALNDYVFERQVTRDHLDGTRSTRRIDLYKRGCFILEAKQGSVGGGSKNADPAQQALFGEEAGKARAGTAKRGTESWLTAMKRARAQAEQYGRDLPPSHGWPPFIIVADIGYCFELYADFFGQGKYQQFPDKRGFRVLLDDLRDPDTLAMFRAIFEDPASLDPTKISAEVTQDIAARLARVARMLEKDHDRETVAHFLMRCLFAMFAEDAELLKKGSFTALLDELKSTPDRAHLALEQVFQEMDKGAAISGWLRQPIRQFNGGLFKNAKALPLTAEMVAELYIAATKDWTQVEPAIFGTLLEQALDKTERHKLGAHYTPRAYVERLVTPTIMEPLRADWDAVQVEVQAHLQSAEDELSKGAGFERSQKVRSNAREKALATLRGFHAKLCNIKVLDPACGTGNFLYVAMERMKRLEGEVVDFIESLGGKATLEFQGSTVDPHQFLGIELNPQAAAIAELVLWIGFIQWQLKTGGQDVVRDPVLKDFHNIENRDAVLTCKERTLRRDDQGRPVTRWDGVSYKLHPITGENVPDEDARIEVYDYTQPKAASWPEADFIIGNPPFIGGKDLRASLGDGYAEALWAAHPRMPKSADLVMYWWDQAARLTAAGAKNKSRKPRRFGFITTNSLRQTFNRRVVEAALSGKPPLSLIYAIPDHPWQKSAEKAAVRIAMTVAEPGDQAEGVLAEVIYESGLNTDAPEVRLKRRQGLVTPMLKVGAAVGSAKPLKANERLAHRGVQLIGAGFIVTPEKARALGLGRNPKVSEVIKPYRNGRDINQKPRGVMVIDLFGLTSEQVRDQYPAIYQHVLENVKPERDQNRRGSYKKNWWIFGEPRNQLRPALSGLERSIVTTETSKHRFFSFAQAGTLADNMLVQVAADEASKLSILNSCIHIPWAIAAGGRLGVGNDPRYNKTRCFDPFPFPVLDDKPALKAQLEELGERLDSFRKERLEKHDFLTMTKLYNVLERVRALEAGKDGEPPLTPAERDIYEAGLVGVLKEIHDQIDEAVFEAYGWPSDLNEDEILERLVALNHERAAEEARGHVRWLRPEFQDPDGHKSEAKATQGEIALAAAPEAPKGAPKLPSDDAEQARALRALLASAEAPITAPELAARFGGKNTKAKIGKVEKMLSILAAVGQAETTPDGRYFAGG
ncbi:class I SAM-dependent DNA methyltransferase [Oceanicaulis sp.]|uniref:class I SAM-dependent DNA methyltransferase n=1 Tax=Oceanicaulis sp. TaxID=1924941 RepID=UPI003BA8CDFB